MQVQGNGQQRGQQGRPTVRAERGEPLIRQLMEERREEIEAMFARDPDPKASYTRAAGLAVNAYKKLQSESSGAIDEYSTVAAALWSFQRKLDPGTEVYFVPYAGKVTPIVSPQGLINLAYRSGLVIDCQARWVFQDEVTRGFFTHMLGTEEWIKHQKGANARPASKDASWRELAFTYSVIRLKGGGQIIEVHDRGDIEYYRSLSKAKAGLWYDWPAEAARKAVLKQALGRAPKQSEVSEILAADNANEAALEIPADFMANVEARLRGEAPQAPAEQQRPAANGAPTKANGATSKPPARSEGPDPFAGDPAKLYMPGKKGETPTIAVADAADLAKWEGRLRTALDDGDMDKPEKVQYKTANIRILATIRQRMRAEGMVVASHEYLDGTPAPRQPDPEAGELTREQEEEMLSNAGDTAGYAG